MLPLLHLGPLVVSTFSAMLLIAFAVGTLLGARQAIWLGQDASIPWRLLPWAAVGGLAGAQLYSIVIMISRGVVWSSAFSNRGQVFYGGLVLGTLLTAWRYQRLGLPFAWLFDFGAPCVAVAHALGRIGCFLVGDDYGYATSAPWGVAFPHGAPPSTAGYLRAMGDRLATSIPDAAVLSVHPVQLYEATVLFALGALLWRASRRPHRPFRIFGAYAVGYGAWRFAIEYVRPKNDRLVIGLTSAQVVSLLLVLVGVLVLSCARLARTPNGRDRLAGAPPAR